MTGFAAYQREIFELDAAGETPPLTTDLAALEEAVRAEVPADSYNYVAGGAGTGSTVRANRSAFERWRIVPRVLRNADRRDLRATVLGMEMPAPVLLAPVGVQSILHPDAELASARAAAELGLPLVLSSSSSRSIEEVAAANGDAPRWMQLYWSGDREICASILDRGKRAGFSTLVVTVDTWIRGWRPHEMDRRYSPSRQGVDMAIPFSDPVFRSRLARPPEEDPTAAIQEWQRMPTGASKSWEQFAFLRDHWSGPIVVKGILHPDDARRAVGCGADGIVVSNHGGRQVDGAVAALDMLPEVVDAVGAEVDVLFDSGIRTGADVIKALALGAKAVLVGRPCAYGLAHAGEAGVRHVLRSLLADLDITLGLCGYRSPAELGRAALR
ncbi:alpha-hydroxy-acid oxidizing protein [Saccharopolyspora phatthalungensis]|uniref:Isopentenyl diphosphate isomerase/L-lactate dehydrogenase-like FMN-dependent dehydrogenase n=1 Tax=Saccharopolyspora phatthalungensis TaxID=664693 RepID=A0A840Q8E1_9PSEU|nr:alpha-hydroxy-acid oxidizing protein [Saccharopolyspora phatthalungensis]MBB5156110.1 isopentenyl diphosphate isomerase/L-lactate dehydrogenase-like FMN-dependent dehydrogenase [Saccharopolyspora phatthalungensis]